MKRNLAEYKDFKIYEDIQPLTRHFTLSNELLLVAGCMYNLTGKGQRPLEKGYLLPAAFKKMLKQHKDMFQANPKVQNFEKNVYPYLKELSSLGIIQELQPKIEQTRYGTSIKRNFLFNDEIATRIKNESNIYVKEPTTNSLF